MNLLIPSNNRNPTDAIGGHATNLQNGGTGHF